MGGKAGGGDADHAAGAGRQAGRRGEKAQARRHGQRCPAARPRSRHMAYLQGLAAHSARAPDQQRRQESQRREAECLQQQIGRHRAQRAQQLETSRHIGVVEAGVVGRNS